MCYTDDIEYIELWPVDIGVPIYNSLQVTNTGGEILIQN